MFWGKREFEVYRKIAVPAGVEYGKWQRQRGKGDGREKNGIDKKREIELLYNYCIW